MADQEIFRVRRKFVEKVSKDMIKQLLDELLQDGFLNEGEKDSIMEENMTRGDQARALIDLVKRKGEVASGRMITHLKERDNCLFSELGLKEEPSTKPIQASDATGKEKPDNRDIYPVSEDSRKSRVALLITNIKFTDEKLNRNGAEKDEENMENLLKSLNYEVVKHSNLTGKEIGHYLVEFCKHPKLKQTDSVVVVIMSHGKLRAILGKDWTHKNQDEFPINDIYKHLDSTNCPALLNKPKIIIIQACRGGGKGSVLVSDGPNTAEVCEEEENIEEDLVQRVHIENNFIAFLSCTPDTVSYRHKDLGSFFISYIVDEFKRFARELPIEELFRKVMQRFELDFKIQMKRQMPTKDRCTLTRHFFLLGSPLLDLELSRELFRARITFIQNVSRNTIYELLDNLLEDGVLNEGEKESIMEWNMTTQGKARALIDSVKRKGNVASGRMITHLKERDNCLFSELGLKEAPSTLPIQTAVETGKEKPSKIYPVSEDSMRSRVALLITNIKFTDEKLNRNGAEKDEENMEDLLKSLNYEVVKHRNLTGKEIGNSLVEFSKHPKLKQTDSVVVVIMSHGKLDTILGKDWKDDNPDEFPITNIYETLDSANCPALLDKPKIIIIQACSGGLNTAEVCDEEENIEEDGVQCVHKEKDLVALLFCTPDTVLYGHPDNGSFFIKCIVDECMGAAHKIHIEELFRKVMQRFEDTKGQTDRPSKDRCTLTRNFYFFPTQVK